MADIQHSLGTFEGKPGNLFLTYDQQAFNQNKYYTAGKLVTWSIMHNGPGLRCLNSELFQLMCGHTPDLSEFNTELIPEPEVQEKLSKVVVVYFFYYIIKYIFNFIYHSSICLPQFTDVFPAFALQQYVFLVLTISLKSGCNRSSGRLTILRYKLLTARLIVILLIQLHITIYWCEILKNMVCLPTVKNADFFTAIPYLWLNLFPQLQKCNTEADFNEIKTNLGDWISECGVPSIFSSSFEDVTSVFTQILKHYIYHR